jgi:hypothetical protein
VIFCLWLQQICLYNSLICAQASCHSMWSLLFVMRPLHLRGETFLWPLSLIVVLLVAQTSDLIHTWMDMSNNESVL